jgi:integrase
MAKQITDTWLRAQHRGQKREVRSERGGLVARKGPNGVTFYRQYSLDGRPRSVWLGVYKKDSKSTEGLTLAEARAEAAQKRVQAAQARAGRALDPAAERKTEKAQARLERLVDPTVSDFAKVYIERDAKQHRKTWKEAERILNADVLPIIGGIKLAEIKRTHVVAVIDDKADAGRPLQAREVFKVLRKMMNFAVERGQIPMNPAAGVKPPAKGPPRRRVLVTEKGDEIGGLFRALASSSVHPGMKLAIEFQLLTAQRPGAVRGARWSEIGKKIWTVPPERMKRMVNSPWADLSNVVPLSVEALAVLEKARALSGESPFVFPGRDDKKPWSPEAIDHELHREAMLASLKAEGVARFNLHDLRRTSVTVMAGLGVMPHVIDRILGHVPAGVTAEHYNIHEYVTEKRAALEKLGKRVAAMKRGKRRAK